MHCALIIRCIMKMDHHCPWINSCVGYGNHTYFMWFLFLVLLGSIHGVIISCNFLYRYFNYVSLWGADVLMHCRVNFPPNTNSLRLFTFMSSRTLPVVLVHTLCVHCLPTTIAKLACNFDSILQFDITYNIHNADHFLDEV